MVRSSRCHALCACAGIAFRGAAAARSEAAVIAELLQRSASSGQENTSAVRDARRTQCGGLYPLGDQSPFTLAGAKTKCQKCLSLGSGCKWCPLSQSCLERGGWLGGDGECLNRGSHFLQDSKVLDKGTCGSFTPPWIEVMEQGYGPDWDRDPVEHADAKRCVQWALGWPVDKDPAMEGSSDDDMGRWACTSALIRDGILGSVGASRAPVAHPSFLETGANRSTRQVDYHRVSSDADSNVSSSGDPWWYRDATTWDPPICGIIRAKLDTSDVSRCYIRSYALDEFKAMRQQWARPNAQGPADLTPTLIQSMKSGPLVTFSPGAGKSGSGFCRTWDNAFKIKLGLKSSSKMNEPENFMRLLKGHGGLDGYSVKMADHLKAHSDSLLNRYHGMLKLRIGDTMSWIVVMSDAFYNMNDRIKTNKQAYDLKGTSRNQKEEKGSGSTLINGDFTKKEHNRMTLSNEQCMHMTTVVEHDTKFLDAYTMIDYSVLILVAHHPTVKCSDFTAGTPFCMDGKGTLYTVSLIDYMNDYTVYKKAEATFVKWGKFDDYGMKIQNFADKICPTDKERAFRARLMKLVRNHNGSVKNLFNSIDTDHDGKINRHDMEAYFKASGLSIIQLKSLVAEADKDKDGTIDLDEFQNMFLAFGIGRGDRSRPNNRPDARTSDDESFAAPLVSSGGVFAVAAFASLLSSAAM